MAYYTRIRVGAEEYGSLRWRNERVLYVRAGERGGGVDLAGEYRKIKESCVAKTQEPGS